jgi:mannose-1-phosphate guanylyltransferase
MHADIGNPDGGRTIYAVIMAGGKGTRFWPRSRERMPKHLLDIVGARTIIQETLARLSPLIPPDRTLVVTGASHAEELMRQLPEVPPDNILIEPMGRNTAPCIGLAALAVNRRSPGAVMAVLPADHLIRDEARFRHVLAAAARVADREAALVTIGIAPTGPETGYGYLENGEPAGTVAGEAVWRVRSIREKPDRPQAESFLRQGNFSWNSGMFVWRAPVILDHIERHLPDLYRGLREIDAAWGAPREADVLRDAYAAMTPISIDYGVMEKARDVLLLKGDFGWSDVGSWDALWEVSPRDAAGNAVRSGAHFVGVEARNSFVFSPKKLVALVDVEDLIVVETEDALLICRRGASQDVKKVVDLLAEGPGRAYL